MQTIIKKIWEHHKKTGDSLLESIHEVQKVSDIDEEDMGAIVRKDKTLLGALTVECNNLNLVQRKRIVSEVLHIF